MASKKSSRRKFLKAGAAAAAVGAIKTTAAEALPDVQPQKSLKELVAYGERSKFVTSVRVPVIERPSPDQFGMLFHVLTPLQDHMGIITPSSLHFVGTHRGAIVPDIDPKEHKLMIHGMVDRPLEFSMDDLRHFPSVSQVHFIECLGNHARPEYKTVQETHGLTSCSEWTGVLLSTLLKECGLQKNASWVVSEGSEEVKGAGSIRLAKAMEDVIVAYGQNGEPLRPQQGFPLRLIVPGFEGIYNVKWLRRIKVVDRYYMTYNDYGHIQKDEEVAALTFQWGPKSVITYPSGGQQLSGPGVYQITGLAWSGGGRVKKVEISTDNGQTWKEAEIRGDVHPKAHTRFGMTWKWDGQECVLMSRCIDEIGQVQPTRGQLAQHFHEPPDYYKTHGVQGSDNMIQPWRVASDGSVHNAIA
ncbi:MAG TPA: sulfite dehydrogenase [Candidatus Acidoferrales bacterium]|jgi:sulfane dehydrogenase subunit SoxC|nr:sulfite dehydrogenase [Candidatus Acidoferrales bacterium]